MPFRRKNSRKKVLFAGIQGLIIGVVGVLLFGVILNISNDKKSEKEVATPTNTTKKVDKTDKSDKVAVNAETDLPFQAKQYGVFTSKESAVAFISEQPTLDKATVVNVDNQYYVWSALFVDEISVSKQDVLPVFHKLLFLSTKGCEDPKVQNVMRLLQEEKLSKKFFESLEKKEDYPNDLLSIVAAISLFTEDSAVIRLHVLTHYLKQQDCLQLKF